jgi:hypothetical protein
VNSLLDEPVETGVKSACSGCGARTRGRGDLLCAVCWEKAPRELVARYRVAWNAVQFEAQPEGRLTVAIANLVAGVRGEPPPYAEPPPPLAVDAPAPAVPPARTPTTLAPSSQTTTAMAALKISGTCSECTRDFEYVPNPNGGRRRTRCFRCSPPSDPSTPIPAMEKTERRTSKALAKIERPRVVAKVRQLDDVPGLNVAEIRATVAAEIERIAQRGVSAQQLLEALDAYEAAQ